MAVVGGLVGALVHGHGVGVVDDTAREESGRLAVVLSRSGALEGKCEHGIV